MLELPITENQKARIELNKLNYVLNGSFTHGGGNIYGSAGEIVALDYLIATGHEAKLAQTYDYDIIADGLRIDVKTKTTNVNSVPDNYICSVSNWNTRQECDLYLFVRVKKDLSIAWILGVISPAEFYKNAFFLKKGQPDPYAPEKEYRVVSDCYNIKSDQLLKI